MAVRANKVWTYNDLLRMPEPKDGKRYEILDGELVVSPSPARVPRGQSAAMAGADYSRMYVFTAP